MAAYNLNEIKEEINHDIEKYTAFINAWNNVKFVTKKDGTPFKQFERNIENAKYNSPSYSLLNEEKLLTVYTHTKNNGYISDYIYCYELIPDMTDKTKLAKTENYMPKQTYLKQVYLYDLEDIKTAINNRIDYLERKIALLLDQLQTIDDSYNNFKTAYGKAIEQLAKDTNASKDMSVYYAILETIKNRYPYC